MHCVLVVTIRVCNFHHGFHMHHLGSTMGLSFSQNPLILPSLDVEGSGTVTTELLQGFGEIIAEDTNNDVIVQVVTYTEYIYARSHLTLDEFYLCSWNRQLFMVHLCKQLVPGGGLELVVATCIARPISPPLCDCLSFLMPQIAHNCLKQDHYHSAP